MKNYRTIRQDGICEETIKKSRFICQMKRISSEAEGREFIAQVKKEHYKATHSCSAMIVGEDSAIKRSSDDGEPSGTAGIPMLTVLEKNHLTNVVAVVTRYFGGIKLGAGGLIRAYAGSVANAIREIGLVEVKSQDGILIELSYPQYQTFANFLKQEQLQETETDFSVNVTTTVYLDKERVPELLEHLTEFYNGNVETLSVADKIIEVPLDITIGSD